MTVPFPASTAVAREVTRAAGFTERRTGRRYGLKLDLNWKLIRRKKVLDSGAGHTIDLSRDGILFDAGRPIPGRLNVELTVVWPVRLHNVEPLELFVTGRVVRSTGHRVAIRMTQHSIRKAAASANHRGASHAAATDGVNWII